ncbi:MAG: hypothetical protein QOD32_449 [Pyrinomonadaceae bacterium]|jgi:VWFA-related protein|nr:hypothetical protein [Pyrinomonadaceae bacterium]
MKKGAWLAHLLALSVLSVSLAPLYAQQGSAPRTKTTPQSPPSQSPQSSSPPSPSPSQSPVVDDDDVVRITTNLVQLDVVVTDKDGRQATDLTAEDFEIREDGRPQPITNFSYIPTGGAPASNTAAAPPPTDAPAPTVRLDARDVRRTIVLIVDDLGLSAESIARVKPLLRRFVETEMQPGDLVAIIRTGGDVGALQQFTADRRQLHRSIERVRWNSCSRQGLSAISSSSLDLFAPSPSVRGSGGIPERPIPDSTRRACSATALLGTMNAIRFVLQGMRELPGRKSMILISDSLPIEDQFSESRTLAINSQAGGGAAASVSEVGARGSLSLSEPLRRISELAIRGSVVIYGIDTRGLADVAVSVNPGNSSIPSVSGMTPAQRSAMLNPVRNEIDSGREVAGSLSRQTGGLLIRNTNDLVRGMHRVMEDQKGYYLIGYRPGSTTFDRRFHKISVHVKRPGLSARTRTGFYGVTDEEARSAPPSARDQTLTALMSPFGAGAINLRLTPLFVDTAETGPILRSLLHVNARDLTFTNEPDGAHKATIEVTGIIFDDNGGVAGQHRRTHTLSIRGRTYERALAEGFTVVFNMPVKKAGAYKFRVAVRDAASARIGAAGQYVEVPDLKKDQLALSGIALAGGAPADAAAAAAGDENDAAVRRFRPGMPLEYEFFVYNAQADKATARPRLTAQAQLFRDGRQVYGGDAAPLDPAQLTDPKRAPARGRLALDGNLPPGEYTLQLVVTDALAKGKRGTATQWIDFEIVK